MQFNKISLQFLTDNYSKIAYSLPIPTYRRIKTKSNHQGYVIVTYELTHSITSMNQFRWQANIKQSMKEHIKVEFLFAEYIETVNQENTSIKYTFKSLQEHFKPIKTIYPKIYLPSNKSDIYQRLCIYASKLFYHKMFHLEMVIYAAIKMNNILKKPCNYKELLNKSIRAYTLVSKTETKQKLTPIELRAALKTGGQKRGVQKKMEQMENKKKIEELIKSNEYIKPNGKINITKVATDLELSRVTVTNIVNQTLLSFFPFFLFIYLISKDYSI